MCRVDDYDLRADVALHRYLRTEIDDFLNVYVSHHLLFRCIRASAARAASTGMCMRNLIFFIV